MLIAKLWQMAKKANLVKTTDSLLASTCIWFQKLIPKKGIKEC